MESKNKVLEALQMQPLSEEEKNSRHILGRLWGPIATTKEKTRNGRGYNAQLWDKALKDEIFREKVANKSLFLELGHPIDREETDMNVVCACIPELPKVIDGDLYAYVDILDTKQGRLLKTLCDYGFVPGISSRGSGDIMANDEVDPETFFLETWDIVQLPAVKKARLTMCESLNNKKTLSKALRESLDMMSEDDKKEAQETLENLGIEIEEGTENDPYPDIPWAPGEDLLIEDTEEVTPVLTASDVKPAEKASEKASEKTPEETPVEADKTPAPAAENKPEQEQAKPALLTEADDDVEEEEEEEEEPIEIEDDTEEKDEVESEDSESDDSEAIDAVSLDDFLKVLGDYDKSLELKFNSIEIDDKIISITDLVLDDEVEEGKLTIDFNYNLETSDNTKEDADEESEVEESSPEDEQPETEEISDEAIDDGEDEVIESLKEMVRIKDALEEEVLSLKNRQTVSDAEVSRLKEELDKYRTGFKRVSELASKATKLQREVSTLNEQLSAKETTIRTLENNAKTKLTESVERTNRQVKELQERLMTSQNEAEATERELREQVEASRKQTREATTAARAYKQKYEAVVNHYIASKATMLGVSTHDITSKLTEGYTFEDVDRICETLLNAGRPALRLGMGAQGTPKVKLKESATKTKKAYVGGYEIDDDLLELAGLK